MFFICFSVLQLFNGKLSFLHGAKNKDHSNKNDIQLSPEGEVNSCFSIYQISWIKMKTITFCNLKMSPSRSFVYNLQTFWGFCQVIFTTFVANSTCQ